jgi:protoporphyrinogen oxidase
MRLNRIAVLGGGPAGLYFGYLWKRRHPEDQVEVFEQNTNRATRRFGVDFSDQTLDYLIHRGERVVLDGVGF